MSIPPPAQPPSTSLPLPHPDAYPGEPREYARALMQRKDDIQVEMDALNEVLVSHNVTPSTPLVDPEGYPRGDIDIYAIRHARSALARLVNDRKTVEELLKPALEAAFAAPSSSSSSAAPLHPTSQTNGHAPPPRSASSSIPRAQSSEAEWPIGTESPIARVNSVAPLSPAAEAGLQAGDRIHSFAGVTVTTAGGMQAIGPLVASSEGTLLTLLVMRDGRRLSLGLTPRSGWGGRGLLGCHILPP